MKKGQKKAKDDIEAGKTITEAAEYISDYTTHIHNKLYKQARMEGFEDARDWMWDRISTLFWDQYLDVLMKEPTECRYNEKMVGFKLDRTTGGDLFRIVHGGSEDEKGENEEV